MRGCVLARRPVAGKHSGKSQCIFKPKNNVVKKTKDVSKVVVKKNISFGDDKNCVLNDLAKKLSND